LVALVPWNFGAWWIARRLRLALELDCDARVLSHTDGTERYGRLLLLIAQRQAQMTLVPMLAESNSHLTKRITAMNTPRPKNPLGRVAVLGLVAVVALAGSASYALDLTKSGPTAGLSFSNARQEPSGTYYMPKGVTPARPVPGSVELKYPESLKTSRVEGEVLTSFVVDTTGRVDSSSVRVLRSTQEPFTQSALAALTTMRFLPAEMKGRKVRQLVQQAFFFDMKGSAASAARKRPAEGRPTMDSTNTNPMTLRPMVVTAR
jgi:TonB family protein